MAQKVGVLIEYIFQMLTSQWVFISVPDTYKSWALFGHYLSLEWRMN